MAEITTDKHGEWCEIEPGVWYEFLPMPHSDEEIIDRWLALKAGIRAIGWLVSEYRGELSQSRRRSDKSRGIATEEQDDEPDLYRSHEEIKAKGIAAVQRGEMDAQAGWAGKDRREKVWYWNDMIAYLEIRQDALFGDLSYCQVWYATTLFREGLWDADGQITPLADEYVEAMAIGIKPQLQDMAHQMFVAHLAHKHHRSWDTSAPDLQKAPEITENLQHIIDRLPQRKEPKPKKAPKQATTKSMF